MVSCTGGLESSDGGKAVLLCAAQSEVSLNQSGTHNLCLCQGLGPHPPLKRRKRDDSEAKFSWQWCNAPSSIFGSPSKTAVNPSFLNAAFRACTAECPGTAGAKAV